MTRLAPWVLVAGLALAACDAGDITAPTPEENPLTTADGLTRFGAVPAPSLGPITTFDGAGTPIFDEVVVTSTIEVAEPGTILDVDVRLSLTHTFDADLTIWLKSPAGDSIVLTANNGGSGNDYTDTDFDDEAATPIASGAAPFTGSFQPEEALSAFDGQDQAGTWTLRIYDEASGDNGELLSWALDIEVEGAEPQEPPEPPAPPAPGDNVTIAGHDTGVPNQELGEGMTFQDAIDACMESRNKGQMQQCVNELANAWMKDGLITGREKGMIASAAAKAAD